MKSTAIMYKPKITIVTVCRNVIADLQRTAASVRRQTYSDYEYVIVDGNRELQANYPAFENSGNG